MVDSISNWATRAFLQTQTNPAPNNNVSSPDNAKKALTVFDQIQKTVEQSKSLMNQASATRSVINASASSNANLPRGSLVDILA